MKSLLNDVAAFHAAMGTTDAVGPVPAPSPELIKLRMKLISEEYAETLMAALCANVSPELTKLGIKDLVSIVDSAEPDGFNLEGVADGLADLIYVCVGAALAFGIPLDRVWAEVQRANMAKLGGPRRADGKILKPEGWQPPNIHEAIFGKAA